MQEADLSRANLRESSLRDVDLLGCALRGADLSGRDLRGTALPAIDAREVELHGAIVSIDQALAIAQGLGLDVRPD